MQELRIFGDGDAHELCVHDSLQVLQRLDAPARRQRMLTP